MRLSGKYQTMAPSSNSTGIAPARHRVAKARQLNDLWRETSLRNEATISRIIMAVNTYLLPLSRMPIIIITSVILANNVDEPPQRSSASTHSRKAANPCASENSVKRLSSVPNASPSR